MSSPCRHLGFERSLGGLVVRVRLEWPDNVDGDRCDCVACVARVFAAVRRDRVARALIVESHSEPRSDAAPGSRSPSLQRRRSATARHWWTSLLEETRRDDPAFTTIAQVSGEVEGPRLLVMSACDYAVAAENTTFKGVARAAVEAWGGAAGARAWDIGPRRAMELMVTGDTIDASAAHALGVVHALARREQLAAASTSLARRALTEWPFGRSRVAASMMN